MSKGRPISNSIRVNDVFKSKSYGELKILCVNSAKDILCEFVATGYKVRTQAQHIRTGSVKDPLSPSILGVGFFGVGKYNAKNDIVAYQKWKNMLTRCYSNEYQNANPSYIGCSVCKEWHNFQAFAKWFYENKPSGTIPAHLDKDIKQQGNKVYSQETCLFVSAQENAEQAHCSIRALTSPNGSRVSFVNISKFARDNNLSQGHLSSVLSGKRKSHKGWRIA